MLSCAGGRTESVYTEYLGGRGGRCLREEKSEEHRLRWENTRRVQSVHNRDNKLVQRNDGDLRHKRHGGS